MDTKPLAITEAKHALTSTHQGKRTKLGFVTKHVLVSNAAWDKIQSHLDNECLDEGKWLTRQFDLFAATLEIK